jgi:hypothetical protein
LKEKGMMSYKDFIVIQVYANSFVVGEYNGHATYSGQKDASYRRLWWGIQLERDPWGDHAKDGFIR